MTNNTSARIVNCGVLLRAIRGERSKDRYGQLIALRHCCHIPKNAPLALLDVSPEHDVVKRTDVTVTSMRPLTMRQPGGSRRELAAE